MAIVEVSYISPVGIGPVENAYFSTSEMITSSGVNQISAGASASGQTMAVTSSGGAIWVAISDAPNATVAGTRRIVPAGATRYFGGLIAGHKAAIVDAV